MPEEYSPESIFLSAGLGSIRRRHLRNLVSLGHKGFLLYRTNQSSLPDDELSNYPVEHNLETALAHSPMAVIVSNPTSLHLDVAIPAARIGCHLFLEKPLSHSIARLDELSQAIKEGGGKVVMGFQFRYHPALRSIKKLIDRHALGRIMYIRCQWGEYLPTWHPWENYRKAYSARKDLGGGVVLTLCHPIDYLHWLFGEINWVNSYIAKISDLELEVEDTAEILLSFSNGILADLHLDYIQQPPQHNMEITGTLGMIRWNNSDGIVNFYQNEKMNWEQIYPPSGFERNSMFLEEMRHFLNVVTGKEESLCTLQDGILVQRVVDAVYRSAQSGKRVKIADS